MAINTVTPVEIASYISENERKKREFEKRNKAVKKGKEPLFGTMVAFYSASEEPAVHKYTTYTRNRKLV